MPAIAKMLAKVGTMDADAYILDLEDSIAPDDKAEALERVSAFLNESYVNKVYVRVNVGIYEQELKELEKYDVGFMLPKFEEATFYEKALEILKAHEVIALVETPKGVVNIEQIAKTPWVDAIAFGAEDYTASVNMENRIEYLLFQKSCIITFSKAYGKLVYDTPSFKLDDEAGFKREVDNAVSLGFDGKLAISPRHIPYINKCFRHCDVEYIKNVIEQFENSDLGVVVIDGKVYEKPHIERLKKILKEHGN